MWLNRQGLLLSGIIIGGLLSFFGSTSAALADRTDPDFLPPDVTLSTSPQAGRVTTTAPGTAGAAAPGQPAAGAGATPGIATPIGMSTAPVQGAGQPRPPAAGSSAFMSDPKISNHGSGMFRGSMTKPDPNKPDPIATIETSKGVIKIMLFRKLSPLTVENFVDLVGKGFYNGLTFHRVEPGFCIQGGDPLGNGMGKYTDPETHVMRFLPLEVNLALKHNAPGVVAMARESKSPNSASCQFYITLAPAPSLDGKYAIFGGVVSGMDVVNNIAIGDKIESVSIEEQAQPAN